MMVAFQCAHPPLDAAVFLRGKPVNFSSFLHRAEMSGSLSKSLGNSSRSCALKVYREHPPKKVSQGIVSILGSEFDGFAATHGRATPSIRRTLSADMSSKKWLAQNGFFSLKNVAASEEEEEITNHSSVSSEGGEEDCGRERGAFPGMWNSVPDEQRKKDLERSGQPDMWAAILSKKSNDDAKSAGGRGDGPLPPPYVHPMVKRSASSMSEKSLEICTESLGSETGSDGFSSYTPSEPGQSGSEEEQQHAETECSQPFEGAEFRVVKYNYASGCQRGLSRSRLFPPPLSSLSQRDGSNLHMRSHRQNGRLVVEAVAVSSQNCFRAQRQDGRLLLSLANAQFNEEENSEEVEDGIINAAGQKDLEEIEEEESNESEERDVYVVEGRGENKEAKELTIIMETVPNLPAAMMNNVQKLIALTKTTTWPHKFNKVITSPEEAGEEEEVSALPPKPRVTRLIPATPATAATLNAYQYYWRSKPAAVAVLNPMTKETPPLKATHANNINKKFILAHSYRYNGNSMEQPEMVIVKGDKAVDLVPLFNGCKEQRRRSLFFWEPFSIATSS
ncbi:hypothetical protein Nepgr_014534 [Nepenthes gracilis]|uniref:FAF domain-containing protein n=1 Tax=Nepenthes gracilis TaxID=150966 RepID=A0AAD3SJP5_NEPGR|nr:hypothetical protein Nepgr_014534 [Nepenthes gracilis]